MSAEDKQFPQRWGFRSNDNGVESSSDDQSASDPKSKKHNLATRLLPGGNDQQAVDSPQLHLGGENNSGHDEPNKELNKSRKKQERKSRARKAVRESFDSEPSNGALVYLRGHMESLVEEVKVAREDMLKWMTNEMEKSFQDDKISEPAQSEKGQRRASKEAQKADTKRSGTPRSNPIKPRRRPGKITKNPEDGSSAKCALETEPSHKNSAENERAENERAENAYGGTIPVEKSVNQRLKRKRPESSPNKKKFSEGNQQSDKHLSSPIVVPSREGANSEKTNSEGGNVERAAKSGNGLMNLTPQLNSIPRSDHKNEIFTRNGMRNFGDYEQNRVGNIQLTGNNISNGTGSVFPFAIPSQGLNGGFSMPNFPSPFGLQYLSHEGFMPGLRMNRGFNESYGAYNQQMRMNGQGGLVPLHSPDNLRPGNLQPR